jgi:hypothetical protein
MNFKFMSTLLTIFLLCSCGKEITNSNKKSDVRIQDQSALLGNSIELDYKKDQNNKFFTIPRGGWAKIPEHPFVISGEPESFRSSIFFNTNTLSIAAEIESIRCDYTSKKSSKNETVTVSYDHYFKGCYASIYSYEEEVNYRPGQEILLDQGKQIIFNVILFEESDDIEITSEINVDWH